MKILVRQGQSGSSHRRRLTRKATAALVFAGVLLGGGGLAAGSWLVGLAGGSGAVGQSATVSDLTINAVASPAAANLLYPGGTGDAVAMISNPNAFPVTVTAVELPANSAYADGYSSPDLTNEQAGCTSGTPSGVTWAFASGTAGSSHDLSSALTIGANATLTVTFTNDVTMSSSAPIACAGTYFLMPSLTGVVATVGGGPATASPATDAWTS